MGLMPRFSFSKALALILAVRLASVYIVQTWYVPDEYWQSLEVSHKLAFGYGYTTWEWTKGIRSYIYPGIFAGVYKCLELAGIDCPCLLIAVPRILQALLSSAADFAFYKWSGNHKWALFMILIQHFWFFTASRTLTNTVETALTTLALARYPFEQSKSSDNGWLCYAVLACVIRPTAAIIWAPLCVYNLLTTSEKKLRVIALTYAPIVFSIVGLSVLIDSYFHGGFVLTTWEFISVNYFNDIGSFYGSLPWHWYFSFGLPAVLGVNMLPYLKTIFEVASDNEAFRTQRLLLYVSSFTLAVYSIFPHKEFRFILPLVPILTYLIQDTLSRWSRKAKAVYVYIVFVVLLLGNLIPAGYLSLYHQRGAMDAINEIRQIATQHPSNTSLLFLMPCHSTPFYSHLHVNVPARFLTCNPDFSGADDYVDEADRFYKNPNLWFQQEYTNQIVGETGKKSKIPSHIIAFDVIEPHIKNVLAYYKKSHSFYNAQFAEGRVGNFINIYERKPSITVTPKTQ